MRSVVWFCSGLLVAAAAVMFWMLIAPYAPHPGDRKAEAAKADAPQLRSEVAARSAQRFLALDSDADGSISAAEWDAFHLGRFDAADANQDGTLTKEEVRAARKALREKLDDPS